MHVGGCVHGIGSDACVGGATTSEAHVFCGSLSALLGMAGGEPAGFGYWIGV